MKIEETALLALKSMDLTSLGDGDTIESTVELCRRASTPYGDCAAVCIWPRFIPYASSVLKDNIPIATVVNFPHGGDSVEIVRAETEASVAYGADEIDLVFPYRALMEGDESIGRRIVEECRAVCGDDKVLKVIVESGMLGERSLIERASIISIEAGADFIKTSTGKVEVNATPEAARIMFETIARSGEDVGFKAAGGIRDIESASIYIELAREIMGEEWIDRDHLRLGASSLLDDLLSILSDGYERRGS